MNGVNVNNNLQSLVQAARGGSAREQSAIGKESAVNPSVAAVERSASPEQVRQGPAGSSVAAQAVSPAEAVKPEELSGALTHLNEYVQKVERSLSFSVDEDSGRTVVKVTDGAGDLVRQIPDELALELAKKLQDGGELNLFNAKV